MAFEKLKKVFFSHFFSSLKQDFFYIRFVSVSIFFLSPSKRRQFEQLPQPLEHQERDYGLRAEAEVLRRPAFEERRRALGADEVARDGPRRRVLSMTTMMMISPISSFCSDPCLKLHLGLRCCRCRGFDHHLRLDDVDRRRAGRRHEARRRRRREVRCGAVARACRAPPGRLGGVVRGALRGRLDRGARGGRADACPEGEISSRGRGGDGPRGLEGRRRAAAVAAVGQVSRERGLEPRFDEVDRAALFLWVIFYYFIL